MTSEQVMHGLGKHIYELSDDDITFALQVSITERLQSRLHWDLRPVEKVLNACLTRPECLAGYIRCVFKQTKSDFGMS